MQKAETEILFPRTHVKTSRRLDFPADQVWDLIAGFDTLPYYHALIEKSRLSKGGVIRYLTLSKDFGSGVVVERLVHFDDDAMNFSYRIVDLIDCSMPFRNHHAWVQLTPIDDHTCELQWESRFHVEGATQEEAETLAKEIYKGCYDGIEAALSN